MLTTAPNPMIAAAMLNPTSSPLTLRADEATGRGAVAAPVEVAPGGRVTGAPVLVGGRDTDAAVESVAPPAAVGGRGAGGADAAGAGVAATPEAGAEGAAGPPAGMVGSLIVGEELGFGGRLMRTVSFLG